MDQAGLN